MEELRYLMGHGSIRTTSDTNGHLFKAAKATLADALDATFRSSPEPATAKTRPKNENERAPLRRVR